jgi:hypothetical protein
VSAITSPAAATPLTTTSGTVLIRRLEQGACHTLLVRAIPVVIPLLVPALLSNPLPFQRPVRRNDMFA